jgi:hypothetical protein
MKYLRLDTYKEKRFIEVQRHPVSSGDDILIMLE